MAARRIAALLALALSTMSATTAAQDAVAPDLPALIECRATYEAFMGLVPVQADPLAAVSLGWRPQPQANLFMVEYQLNTPIEVFGHRTTHILAVLDLEDPRVLARELQLETGIDTPEKVLFGLEVRAEEVAGADGQPAWIDSAVINVSNVDSHPGKTLAGCSYSRDPLEPEEPEIPGGASPTAALPR
jgi:hypothetical protein